MQSGSNVLEVQHPPPSHMQVMAPVGGGRLEGPHRPNVQPNVGGEFWVWLQPPLVREGHNSYPRPIVDGNGRVTAPHDHALQGDRHKRGEAPRTGDAGLRGAGGCRRWQSAKSSAVSMQALRNAFGARKSEGAHCPQRIPTTHPATGVRGRKVFERVHPPHPLCATHLYPRAGGRGRLARRRREEVGDKGLAG